MNDKLLVIPGVQMPFFPMRPTTGSMIRGIEQIDTIMEMISSHTWEVQPKLNGDRVTVAVIDGKAYAQNRHGKWYSYTIENLKSYLALPNRTLLDGEVYEKMFYPFEALAIGGESLMRECPSVRIGTAKAFSHVIGVEWKFETPTREWLIKNFQEQTKLRVPVWEGIVRKKVGTPYAILGSDSQESTNVFKNKWIK